MALTSRTVIEKCQGFCVQKKKKIDQYRRRLTRSGRWRNLIQLKECSKFLNITVGNNNKFKIEKLKQIQ